MFLDASAIIAILAQESDGPELAARIDRSERAYISPIAIYEVVLAIGRIGNVPITTAEVVADGFLIAARAETIPISPEIGRAALNAFDRFGRGRHPARLNMGDCFAYACAKTLAVPLLFKGDDFSQTDVAVA